MDSEFLKGRARRLIAAANQLLVIASELEVSAGGRGANGGFMLAESVNRCVEDDKEGRIDRLSLRINSQDPTITSIAIQEYNKRRIRDTYFGASLFGEPAWDILLDLYRAMQIGKQISITSACIASSAPATTALRYIKVLETKGFVVREDDITDSRRSFVRLSAETFTTMTKYLSEIGKSLLDQIDDFEFTTRTSKEKVSK